GQFSATSATATGGGLGNVVMTGIGIVNVFSGGLTTVTGRPFTPENFVVTPVANFNAYEISVLNQNPVFSIGPILNISGALTVVGDGPPGDGDMLTIAGTGSADKITLTSTQVTVNADAPFRYTAGNFSAINIQTLAGDDSVTVDVNAATGSDVIGVPINFDGGDGRDALTVNGTSTTAVNQVTYTPGPGPGAGRLAYTDVGGNSLMTIGFANLEPVTD